MSPRTCLPILPVSLLIIGFAAFAPLAHANPTPTPMSAAELKKQAAEEARKQAKAEHAQLAQGYYNDIHGANPSVTLDQIQTMSAEDLRRLYFRSYLAKGMTMADARSKSQALKIWDN